MEQRINLYEKGYKAAITLYGFGKYLVKSPIEKRLLHLLEYRVSQINGCAYCLDMHSKDLRAEGETEQRIYCLAAWREAPFYTKRERAALAWAEALTEITDGHVQDEVYKETLKEFSEEEIIDLTMAVLAINNYNRVNIAFRVEAGTYYVGQHEVKTESLVGEKN
jgi:AhpD family alkylhydroperoxidase